MPKQSITQDDLKLRVHYDPETGIFTSLRTGKPYKLPQANTYLTISIRGKLYPASKLAWLYCHGYLSAKTIDHINRNKQDDRLCNLREVTASQNSHNKENRPNRLGYPGVVASQGTPTIYTARIMYKGKLHEIGRFDSLKKAAAAYREAKKKIFTDAAALTLEQRIPSAERLRVMLMSSKDQLEFVKTYKQIYPWMTRDQRFRIFGV